MSTQETPAAAAGASRRTPFLDRQFLLLCVVYTALTLGLAGWQALQHGLAAPVLIFPVLAVAFMRRELSRPEKLFYYGWHLVMSALMVAFQFSFSYMLPFFKGYKSSGGTSASSRNPVVRPLWRLWSTSFNAAW